MTSHDVAAQAEQLLDFFYRCPVGLISFAEDGRVHHVNPEAVKLLAPALGVVELTNIVDAVASVWPELLAIVQQRTPGRLVDDHHLRGRGGASWALACSVVRIDDDHLMMVVSDATDRVAAEDALRESEQRFHVMAAQMPLPMWSTSPAGRPDWANEAFLEYFRVSRDEFVAGRWVATLHADDEDTAVASFRHAVAERTAARATLRAARGDGEMRWFDTWLHPRFDDGGAFLGHLGTAVDVTERVEVERAIRESEEFTRRVLDNLFTFVGVMSPDGTLLEANRPPLEAAGVRAEDVIGRKFWDCYWWSHSGEVQQRLREAVQLAAAGEAVRYDELIRVADDGRMWIDFALVPLRDGSGEITHLVPSGLDLTERKLAEQQRIDLLASEQRARRQLELLERNATHLAAVTTVDELARSVLDDLSRSFGLDLASVNVLDGDRIRLFVGRGVPDEAIEEVGPIGLDAELPGADAIRTNALIELPTTDTIRARYPIWTGEGYGLSVGSMLAVPLRSADQEPIGAIVVSAPTPHWFDADAVTLLAGMAGQTGAALERAQLFERVVDVQNQEHAIAQRLQHALLPDRVVDRADVEIGVRLSAASDMLAVGGDWYDTFAWPGGEVGVIVGDVVGHDIEAAAAMGWLRAGAAAIAPLTEPSPVDLLDRLDRFARVESGADFSTAFCVVIDPAHSTCRYASAGHPPALVVAPDGRTRWLDSATSPPLGALPDSTRTSGAADIVPGTVVVLFTDGLVEHRRRGLAEGLAELERQVVAAAALEPQALADRLIATMIDEATSRDDVAVLVVRWR